MLCIDRKYHGVTSRAVIYRRKSSFCVRQGLCTVGAGIFRPLKYHNDHLASRKGWAGAITITVKELVTPRCMAECLGFPSFDRALDICTTPPRNLYALAHVLEGTVS